MFFRCVLALVGISILCGCTLPREFQQRGDFESEEAFGITPGITRAEAKNIIAAKYAKFHFIFSTCFRIDYPRIPDGHPQQAFGPIDCPREGEDVYHTYSGMKFANIKVIFRDDRVTRVRWDVGEGYIG